MKEYDNTQTENAILKMKVKLSIIMSCSICNFRDGRHRHFGFEDQHFKPTSKINFPDTKYITQHSGQNLIYKWPSPAI